jgi:hypothetical protein
MNFLSKMFLYFLFFSSFFYFQRCFYKLNIFVGLGFELISLLLQSRHSTTWATFQVHFLLWLFCRWGEGLKNYLHKLTLNINPSDLSLLKLGLQVWASLPSFLSPLLSLSLFCFYGTGVWTQGLHLELLYQPFFVMSFFQMGVSQIICLDWLWTSVLPISAPE